MWTLSMVANQWWTEKLLWHLAAVGRMHLRQGPVSQRILPDLCLLTRRSLALHC